MIYECEPEYIPRIGDVVKLTPNGKCEALMAGENKPKFGTVMNIYKQNDKLLVGFNEDK